MEYISEAKGGDTDRLYAVLYSSIKVVFPRQAITPYADILLRCLPPSDMDWTKSLGNAMLPFKKNRLFSNLLHSTLYMVFKAMRMDNLNRVRVRKDGKVRKKFESRSIKK